MKYEFNEHHVCTNPTIFLQIQTKEHYATLKICQLPNGKWVYGYRFGVSFGNFSGCSGPASLHGEQYPTEDSAKKAILNIYTTSIQKMIKKAKEYNQYQHEYTQKHNQTKPATTQTTLF